MRLDFLLGFILMGITVAPAIVAYHQPMDSLEDDLDESQDADCNASMTFSRNKKA